MSHVKFLVFSSVSYFSHVPFLTRYCVPLKSNRNHEPQRLTELGYSYGNPRDTRLFSVDESGTYLVTCRSSLVSPNQCLLYKLSYDKGQLVPGTKLLATLLSSVSKDENGELGPKFKGW